ncbi:MAG: hypothetical protein ACXVKA_12265 [Acidimicrobiia bacterium]
MELFEVVAVVLVGIGAAAVLCWAIVAIAVRRAGTPDGSPAKHRPSGSNGH